MDIRCPKCGEPWDMEEINLEAEEISRYEGIDYDEAYQTVRKQFYAEGCLVFGVAHNDTKAHPVVSAMYELLGDDLDGAAAMLEDAEFFGIDLMEDE